MRIFAVGDIHGRLDLLRAINRTISEDLERRPPGDWRILYLGDYCDRGPDTRGVISYLVKQMANEPRVVALRGNHDQSFLDFVGAGDRIRVFERYGGFQTAGSYGVTADFTSQRAAQATKEALVAAMPADHLRFLAGLPLSAQFGDFFFCHAGIRPGVPLAEQDPNDLIWIREAFLEDSRLHPKVIVHGHTPVEEAEIMPNRVDVDTGAYFSGVLTALVIEEKEKRQLTVSGPAG
ncbi:MAG: serine/threonine protein phosphatase [Rhizobiaceae bacterium]|nr:serine/threonine protein phosphatase [Rhizobiaceae bacterium]